MKPIIPLSRNFAVTGVLEAADFAEAARMGFKAIISNLPDGESPRHPSSAEAAKLASAAGLAFRHVPTTKFDLLSDRVVSGTVAALQEVEGPVLAHCFSGMRSAFAWGAAAARFQPAEAVVAQLAKAGFDAAPLQDDLAALKTDDEAATPTLLRVPA